MKLFTAKNLLIGSTALIVILAVTLAFIILKKANEPTPNSSTIKVIKREGNIVVPDKITAGTPFNYRVKGEKFVNNGADVRQQINCVVNNSESIVTIGTFYSNTKKGRFNITRSTVVPVTSRIKSSPKCFMQSIATYIFYQVDKNGDERNITIQDTGRSNEFELVVPDIPQDVSSTKNQVSSTQNMIEPTSDSFTNSQSTTNNSSSTNVDNSTTNNTTVQPESNGTTNIPLIDNLIRGIGL